VGLWTKVRSTGLINWTTGLINWTTGLINWTTGLINWTTGPISPVPVQFYWTYKRAQH
ncbi:7406_t:CDS:1, partial [Racocetra persica]